MDNFNYRARRILPAALAWLLGGGQTRGIVLAYSLVNIVAWLALAAVLWRLLAVRDARGWIAWAGVLFSAGALSSVRLSLTDLPALLLIALAVHAAERWHGRGAVATLALGGLARETSLLAVAGLCKAPWLSAKNLARLALVAAPLAAWLAYIRWRLGPADAGWGNFTLPLAGLLEKLRDALAAAATLEDQPLAWTTLLATLALLVQAGFFVARWHRDERWWRIGAAYTLMMAFLGTAVWEGFPGAATRVLLPLQLAFNVLASRRRASLALLLLGNLSVFSGLLALRDVPRDETEIATLRAGDLAAIAHSGEGWHGREEHRRHVWFWTAQRGTVALEAWPQTERTLALRFQLRALRPCTVTVRQDGRELARFDAGPKLAAHVIHPLRVAGGRTTLEFSTDDAPVPENATPAARALAFALYDVELAAKP
jgi:hypothetical protein